MKPKDHTTIFAGCYGEDYSESINTNLYYRNYRQYENLPGVAKSESTKMEYHAYVKHQTLVDVFNSFIPGVI